VAIKVYSCPVGEQEFEKQSPGRESGVKARLPNCPRYSNPINALRLALSTRGGKAAVREKAHRQKCRWPGAGSLLEIFSLAETHRKSWRWPKGHDSRDPLYFSKARRPFQMRSAPTPRDVVCALHARFTPGSINSGLNVVTIATSGVRTGFEAAHHRKKSRCREYGMPPSCARKTDYEKSTPY